VFLPIEKVQVESGLIDMDLTLSLKQTWTMQQGCNLLPIILSLVLEDFAAFWRPTGSSRSF
jgi:hypothetical protein